MNKKAICKYCGVVNEINIEQLSAESKSDWLYCDLPVGFEWNLPAGKITPVVGDPIYISGFGEHLSWEEYLLKYNIDPEIAYLRMRKRSEQAGKPQSASRNKKADPRLPIQVAARPVRTHDLLDDDDWTS